MRLIYPSRGTGTLLHRCVGARDEENRRLQSDRGSGRNCLDRDVQIFFKRPHIVEGEILKAFPFLKYCKAGLGDVYNKYCGGNIHG